jgi:hypothetical protein
MRRAGEAADAVRVRAGDRGRAGGVGAGELKVAMPVEHRSQRSCLFRRLDRGRRVVERVELRQRLVVAVEAFETDHGIRVLRRLPRDLRHLRDVLGLETGGRGDTHRAVQHHPQRQRRAFLGHVLVELRIREAGDVLVDRDEAGVGFVGVRGAERVFEDRERFGFGVHQSQSLRVAESQSPCSHASLRL